MKCHHSWLFSGTFVLAISEDVTNGALRSIADGRRPFVLVTKLRS